MYKIDTHVHTKETSPCASISAADTIHLYKQANYDTLIITDHYYPYFFEKLKDLTWAAKVEIYLKGYREALIAGNKQNLNVLLGMELCFKDDPNDYLVYGITEEMLYEYPELYKYNLATFKKKFSSMNVLVFQAHPFRTGMKCANPDLLDGVEVYNGNPRHNSRNNQALNFAIKNTLKMTSGSDFHEYEDIARGGIITNEIIKTMDQFTTMINENISYELITS